jgi:hypothetical protein
MSIVMPQNEQKHLGEWRIPSAVAVLLIALVVCGATWAIWRWMKTPPVNTDAVAVDAPTHGLGRRAAGEPPGRIFKRDDGSIRAFCGNIWLTITPPNREMALRCGSGDDWLNKDQQLVLRMAQRWSRGGNGLRNIQFTDEQKQQMKLISAEPAVPLSADDKTKMEGLIKTWEAAKDAAKPEAQRAVLLALRDIAGANIPAAKDTFVASVNKLGAITPPQQLDQYRQLEMARRNPPAAPRKAVSPTTAKSA